MTRESSLKRRVFNYLRDNKGTDLRRVITKFGLERKIDHVLKNGIEVVNYTKDNEVIFTVHE